ncbi:heparan-alpha-glucosaminide N-acetyltransferase domain-containing protein [Agilicoccus flavus]|uniref:heparan-alpha-glucosaminide N-acetyltransferase domain-containing protein n=1 Tax=Agilicoccus flavus TaxID=2775968 RepID=UPI001CF62EE1|nr:heparan-alpha-glucosaminide N-acetyltransferase domain-containing protein [Agilicoccus flavus]
MSTVATTGVRTEAPLHAGSDVPIPHDCVTEAVDPPERSTSGSRLIGIDAARGLALIGMVAVHTVAPDTADGDVTAAWQLASGNAAALFAVIGGVGLAFVSGRTVAPRGAAWARAAIGPVVRGLVLILVGGLLGAVVLADDAKVILAYYGVLFIASTLLLPLRTRALLAFGLGWAVLGPVVGHAIRAALGTTPPAANFTLGAVAADPLGSLEALTLGGFYPALTWIAYLAVGLGLGRAALGSRRVVARLVAGGAALTVAVTALSWFLVEVVDVWGRIAQDVQGHMSLDDFTDALMWGGDGTLPTDSWWWLTVDARHTATPLDLLHTIGLAVLVLGLMLALSHSFGARLRVLAVPGSMTLTLYCAHLLLIEPLGDLPGEWHFATQILLLTAFALVWNRRFRRGPLEWMMWRLTKAVTPGARRARYVPRHAR